MPLKASSVSPVVEPLCRITDLWLDPKSAIRLKGIEALQVSTGYPARIIERALTNAFEELSRDKLVEFIRSEEIRFRSRSNAVVLHVGAGNVFTSWLHGAVMTLLLSHRCWVKPSSSEPVFARLWHESIRMVDFTMADRLLIVPWSDDLLKKADVVVAYGSDETLDQLRQKADPKSILIGFGHKLSVAVVFQDAGEPAAWPAWHQRAIADCEMFELNGCLSPQMFYVEGNHPGVGESLQKSVQPAPELRSFNDLPDLLQNLKPFAGHLSTVGIAGPEARLLPIRSELEKLGVTRFCELGRMQRPPLSWRNGGISLVEILAKIDGNA